MRIQTLEGKDLGRLENTRYYHGRHLINYNASFCGRMGVDLDSKMPDEVYFDALPGLFEGEIYTLLLSEHNSIIIEIKKIEKKRIKAFVREKTKV